MEQQGLVFWFRQRFPDVVIFAIPNGGYRDMHTAKSLRLEGVLSGVPDLYIPCWKLWVEVKTKNGGVVSEAQYKMIDYLRGIGDTVFIAKGAEDGSRQILKFYEMMEHEV
jgi:hypothetical protein